MTTEREGNSMPRESPTVSIDCSTSYLEENFDWTKIIRDRWNPVRDQQRRRKYLNHLNIYNFSICACVVAVEAVECKYMIEKTKERISLSEQELDDNYHHYYPPLEGDENGLNYCTINKSLKYITNHGISRREDWPFTGIRAMHNEARQKPKPDKAVFITGYSQVLGGEEYICAALRKQPLCGSLYINDEFKNLKKGVIFRGCKGDERARGVHAVLIVGYGLCKKTRLSITKYKIVGERIGETMAMHELPDISSTASHTLMALSDSVKLTEL